MKKVIACLASLLLLFGPSEAYGKPSSNSKPSYSSGSKPSYSNNGSKPNNSKPSYSNGNSKPSYSSGSSKPSVNVAPTNNSSNKTYSNGNSYSANNKKYTAVNPSGSSKPKGGAFDGNAAQAQARAESKQNYIKGPEPKSIYTTPAGKEMKIDHNSKSVSQIRSMDHNTYVTRETRIYNTYGSYYGRPAIVFNDPYNTFFWYWMLDRSLDDRAYWAYHHRSEMDEARYKELLSKDAKLEAKIRQLEAEKLPKDPNYVPKGIDPDLQYSDEYVDNVYNPHSEESESSGIGTVFVWILVILVIGAVIWFIVWIVFCKNW